MPLQSRTFSSPVDVVDRPPQVRLQDDPEVLVAELRAGRGTAAACDRSSTSPPCRSARSCRAPARRRRRASRFSRQRSRSSSSPRRGQLDRDVRVEALAVDPREQVVVLAGDRARLVGARDLLAEDVDRRAASPRRSARGRRGRRRRASGRRCSARRAAARPVAGRPAGAGRSCGRNSNGRGAPRAAPIVVQTDQLGY